MADQKSVRKRSCDAKDFGARVARNAPMLQGIRSSAFAMLVALALSACTSSGTPEGGETPVNPASDAPPASTFSKSYGGPLHDEGTIVLNTADGGFLLLGTADGDNLVTAAPAPGGGDWWLQKLDANGNVEFGRLFGERPLPADTRWRRARPLPDGGAV